jgi:hypothetical protein
VRDAKNSDGHGQARISAKGPAERNIPLYVTFEDDLSSEELALRDVKILSEDREGEILEQIQNTEFDLCLMPYEAFNGEDQKKMVDKTLNAALRESSYREVVFAVPYLPTPASKSGLRNFWMEHSDDNYGSPFGRYADLKEYVIDSIQGDNSVEPEDVNRVHFTFVEMGKDGKFPNDRLSLSYLPPHYRPLGQFSEYLMGISKRKRRPLKTKKTNSNIIDIDGAFKQTQSCISQIKQIGCE